jgi:hypothetical protein
MNSETTKDSGVSIIASDKFDHEDIYGANEVEVLVIRADARLIRSWLETQPPNTLYDYRAENEWRHYASGIAERRAEVEAELHTALGIFADYEQEAVIIKHIIGGVFTVAHVKAPPAEDAEEDGEQ